MSDDLGPRRPRHSPQSWIRQRGDPVSGTRIGVNSTVFSLLDGMYLRMLPVPHPDRVVAMDRHGGMPLSWRDYLAVRGDLRAFSSLAASQARGTFMDVERANFGIVVETVSVNYADVPAQQAARVDPAISLRYE